MKMLLSEKKNTEESLHGLTTPLTLVNKTMWKSQSISPLGTIANPLELPENLAAGREQIDR